MLLALVDADYKFICVDIGCENYINDWGVSKNCELYRLLAKIRANISPPSPVEDLSDEND